MLSITKTEFWKNYHDLLIFAILSTATYAALGIAYWIIVDCQRKNYDLDDESTKLAKDFIWKMTSIVLGLSLITTPLAIYYAATNDQLSFPIRLLASAENANKFLYAIFQGLWWICNDIGPSLTPKRDSLQSQSPSRCSNEVNATFAFLQNVADEYNLTDMAQYCQFLISISRFFALAFDGSYFKYTTRWPFAQLVFPYLLRILLQLFTGLFYNSEEEEGGNFYNWINDFLTSIPYLMACGLDFVTGRRMRQWKGREKPLRTEMLLTMQMITTSCLILINYYLAYVISIFIVIYVGWNLQGVFDELVNFNQCFLFHLVASIISVLFLRKPRERPLSTNTRKISVGNTQ